MILFRLFGAPRRRSRSRGQSLVEFALVLPVLLLIMMIGLDFGRVFLGWVNLNQAARIGANFAALNPNANWADGSAGSARDRYNKLIQGDAAAINCTLPATPPPPTYSSTPATLGSRVTVTISCNFTLLTPLISAILPNPLPVSATAQWPIRSGSLGGTAVGTAVPSGSASPVPLPTPTPVPSPSPSPTPTPVPSGTPLPSPTPSAPPPAVPVAGFYGDSTQVDSTGGGVTGEQIVGPFPLTVDFVNQSSGVIDSYLWEFGPAGATSTSPSPSYTYTSPGLYTVRLTVTNAGGSAVATRTSYVLVGCQVPNLAGVTGRTNATQIWTSRGFAAGNLKFTPNQDFEIVSQTLQGGLVNPPGGCDAEMTVKNK